MELNEIAAQLYQWTPMLNQLASVAGEPRSPHGNTGHAPAGETPVEQAAARRAEIETLQARMAALAAEAYAAHSGEDTPLPEQPPAFILMMLSAWIDRTPYARGMRLELEAIHSAAARLLGYSPDKDEALCPYCVQRDPDTAPRMSRWPGRDGLPDLYTCPACGYVGNHDTYGFTQRIRILDALAESTDYATPTKIAGMLGIPAATVRTWKRRGELETNADGLVSIASAVRRYRKTH